MSDHALATREKLRELLTDAQEEAAASIWRDIRKEQNTAKRLQLLATADALEVAVRTLRIGIDRAERF